MATHSAAADAAAHRLLAATAQAPATNGRDARAASPAVDAGERVLAEVSGTLARWFGPYGYHALLTRSLAQARAAHPALESVRVRTAVDPQLDGLPDAATAHGEAATIAALHAVLAGVVDLLGRVIGEDMALQLVESGMNSATNTIEDAPGASAAHDSPRTGSDPVDGERP